MVRVGDFTLQLVAADTKEPFKEHTAPDGQVYAEVEPDMDYYISVRTVVGGVAMTMHVDGVDLGYKHHFKNANSTSFLGSWSRTGSKERMTALHFNKTREAHGVAPNMLTGKVKVKIHQRGDEYYKEPYDYVSRSLTVDSTLGGKKCIKSTTSGSHSFERRSSKKLKGSLERKYKVGKHICTITLNYCSALGLIYNKILPPPPALEGIIMSSANNGGRKRKRSTIPSNVTAAAVSPEMNNPATNTESIGRDTVTVQLTYDLVDLTGDD